MASPRPSEPPDKKRRLDIALVERGLARSRGEAQEMIRSGVIWVSGRPAGKAGQLVGETDILGSASPSCRYVSRGGLKLEAALAAFAVDPSGKKCLDVGASTGGFTDCLLQHGAAFVTAIDVGHGQMDRRLLESPRLRHFEGINARYLSAEEIGELDYPAFDLIAVDLSFISLTLVLPALYPLLASGGRLLLLIKPQFEVGRERLGKRGIVTDALLREGAVAKICDAATSLGLSKTEVTECPVVGGDGNREYLAAFARLDGN